MNIPFYKCNSKGNDFIIIPHDNNLDYKFFSKDKIQSLCHYNSSSSMDGLILLNIKNNRIIMDYYNNDGSWETFCLNGVVCCSLVLFKELKSNQFDIISNNIVYKIEMIENNNVSVQIDKPIYKKKNIKIDNYRSDYLDSGAKHLVIHYKEGWKDIKVLKEKMQKMRYNKIFNPDGINVNFYKIIKPGIIEVKTYEKGIESLMDSCASGSYACAYDYSKKNSYNEKINVINDGGDSQIVFGEDYNRNFFISKGLIEYKGELEI